jgi:hypothetical protein
MNTKDSNSKMNEKKAGKTKLVLINRVGLRVARVKRNK